MFLGKKEDRPHVMGKCVFDPAKSTEFTQNLTGLVRMQVELFFQEYKLWTRLTCAHWFCCPVSIVLTCDGSTISTLQTAVGHLGSWVVGSIVLGSTCESDGTRFWAKTETINVGKFWRKWQGPKQNWKLLARQDTMKWYQAPEIHSGHTMCVSDKDMTKPTITILDQFCWFGVLPPPGEARRDLNREKIAHLGLHIQKSPSYCHHHIWDTGLQSCLCCTTWQFHVSLHTSASRGSCSSTG